MTRFIWERTAARIPTPIFWGWNVVLKLKKKSHRKDVNLELVLLLLWIEPHKCIHQSWVSLAREVRLVKGKRWQPGRSEARRAWVENQTGILTHWKVLRGGKAPLGRSTWRWQDGMEGGRWICVFWCLCIVLFVCGFIRSDHGMETHLFRGFSVGVPNTLAGGTNLRKHMVLVFCNPLRS